MKSIIVALQTQLSLVIGFGLSLLVSYFFLIVDDKRFASENPNVIWLGFLASSFLFGLGTYLARKYPQGTPMNLREGAVSVFLTWVFAVTISASVFVLAGFPIPNGDFSILRSFIDGVFESISGFTTAGGSILPSVEVFPRSVLFWRSFTHFLGGMGMAYMAITLLRGFRFRRETIINAEAEGPNYTKFPDEPTSVEAGVDFLKIYSLLTLVLFLLLMISGALFRTTGYSTWYDDVFDSATHSFSVMGTGGFGTYDASAGLPITENGTNVAGGLRNPVSEWIIAIFMFIAGSNLALWFVLFYKRRVRDFFASKELRTYTAVVALITIGIWLILLGNNSYNSAIDALRYAFFNVTTIISTTGLATTDFTTWPTAAEGLLFICYLIGGMVGSTAGGLKVLRFMVLYKYVISKVRNLLQGKHITRFQIDGVTYDESSSGLIMANIVLYFIAFMLGAVMIMLTSSNITLLDGTKSAADFTSAVTASIANLGNIGPAVEIGNINAGPTGNYFAYSEASKLVMSGLMLIGRLGIVTIITLFITRRGMDSYDESIEGVHFDSDEPLLHS